MSAKGAAIGVAAVVVALVCAEVAVRVVSPDFPTPQQLRDSSMIYVASPHARSALPKRERTVRPNATTSWRLNALGYRGTPLAPGKDSKRTRLVVMGGSAAFDLGASDPHDWPHELGRLLNEAGHPVDVINAALPGHTVTDSLGRLRANAAQWAPDIVLLYHGWNDIKELPLAATPTVSFSPNPLLQPPSRLAATLAEASQLYARLRHLWLARGMSMHTIGAEGRRPTGTRDDAERRSGLARLQANVTAFVSQARSHGALAVVVHQASLLTANTSEASRSRIDYASQGMRHATLLEAFGELHAVLERVAKRTSTPIFDAHAALRGDDALFDDHVHLSRKGSSTLAAWLAKRLQRLIKPAPAAP